MSLRVAINNAEQVIPQEIEGLVDYIFTHWREPLKESQQSHSIGWVTELEIHDKTWTETLTAEEVCEQEAEASEGAAVNLFARNALAAMSTKRTPQSSTEKRQNQHILSHTQIQKQPHPRLSSPKGLKN